jgi:hypothetical protein
MSSSSSHYHWNYYTNTCFKCNGTVLSNESGSLCTTGFVPYGDSSISSPLMSGSHWNTGEITFSTPGPHTTYNEADPTPAPIQWSEEMKSRLSYVCSGVLSRQYVSTSSSTKGLMRMRNESARTDEVRGWSYPDRNRCLLLTRRSS